MSKIKVNSLEGVGASTPAISIDNASGTCTANITNNLSNRNLIINGAMQISQRGTTFASAANSAYQLDRYKFVNGTSAGVFTISQSTTSPDGFSKSWKIVPTTSDTPSGNETVRFMQVIEGHNLQSLAKGTSGAKKSVLSFYVKTNKTGVYSVFLYDADNNRQFNGTYTVSDTNWNRYTIDIPADTTGAYGDDNGGSLEIIFHLAAASGRNDGASVPTTWISYGGTASEARGHTVTFADSTSNEFYITGMQYEVNESGVATDFEHRSFAQELDLCRRYFQQISPSSDGVIALGNSWTTTFSKFVIYFNPNMRTAPTVNSNGTVKVRNGSGQTQDHTGASITLDEASTSVAQCRATNPQGGLTSGGVGQIRVVLGTTNNLQFTAEL